MALSAKALVKETSITTGTGSYTLAGASAGFRTFNAAYGNGADVVVPYVARMGSDYEIGFGVVSAAATLARTLVIESSNADAAVNWAAGTKTIHSGVGGVMPSKHIMGAVAKPLTTDNYALGYNFGSFWYYNYVIYVCTNPGFPSAPNAGWIEVGNISLYTTATYRGNVAFGEDIDCSSTSAYNSFGFGSKALIDFVNSTVLGFNPVGGAARGTAQSIHVGGGLLTANATPDIIFAGGDWEGQPLTVPVDAIWRIRGTVTAFNRVDSVGSAWEISCVVRRTGTADPVFIGTPDVTMLKQDAAAAAWVVALTINNIDNAVETTVTGAAAKNITWTMDYQITQGAFS